MNKCRRCYDTGISVTGLYCSCDNGLVLKAIEKEKRTGDIDKSLDKLAQKLKAKMDQDETAKQLKQEREKQTRFEVGDWVVVKGFSATYDGTLCEVIDTSKAEQIYKLLNRKKRISGFKVESEGFTGWLSPVYLEDAKVELYPVEKREMDELLHALKIDWALLKNDKKLFEGSQTNE